MVRRAAELRQNRQELLLTQERKRQELVAARESVLEETRIRSNLQRLQAVLPTLPPKEQKDLVRLFIERVEVRRNTGAVRSRKEQEDVQSAARTMEIRIKLHLPELVRSMEQRAHGETQTQRRSISVRGLTLDARVDFSNAQRGEVTVIAPFRQVLRIQERVRTVPKPKPVPEHPIIRAQKWNEMLQSGEVSTRWELAKRVKLTPSTITRILNLIELDPGIQAYLAELKTASAILHFGYHPMEKLRRLQPAEQRAAFDQMRAAYEGIEQRRHARERTIVLPTTIRSLSRAPRISAG